MSKETIAKGIRVVTVPPVLIICTLLLFWALDVGVFDRQIELALAILFLGVIPAAAYPLQNVIPWLKGTGREGQRNLAFACSLLGYALGAVAGALGYSTPKLMLIYLTYFLSVLILTFVNKCLHEKASGHACSTTGSLLFAVLYIGPFAIIPCAGLFAVMTWSSVVLGRHTPRNIATGAVVVLISVIASYVMISIM